jgi:uncharacterized protein (TIGR00251 family)
VILADLVVARGDGASFDVRVVPGASRCAILLQEGGLRVRIDAPPVDGAANERLLRYLAREVLDVPVRTVTMIRGERGRNKTIGVDLAANLVCDRLAAALQSR